MKAAVRVCFASSAGTPGESGWPKVSAPEPAFTSIESAWPWYPPSNLMILSRPVYPRASRTRAHRRLGPGGDEADLLDGGERLPDQVREPDLARRGSPVARSPPGGRLDGGDDLRGGVPEDHRPPRADVVDEGVPVHVADGGALRALDEQGGSPDGSERADGGVDAARDHRFRKGEQLARGFRRQAGHGSVGLLRGMGFMARGGIVPPRDRSVKVNSGISAGFFEFTKRHYRIA